MVVFTSIKILPFYGIYPFFSDRFLLGKFVEGKLPIIFIVLVSTQEHSRCSPLSKPSSLHPQRQSNQAMNLHT